MAFAKGHIFTVIVGLVLISVGVVINFIPSWVMQSSMPLVPQSKSFPTWQKVDLPIYMKFFVFNLTNSIEFENGSDPEVEEVGPYVYKEVRARKCFDFNEDVSEITFTERVYYMFDQEKSGNRTEDDEITNVNIPLLAVFEKLKNLKTMEPDMAQTAMMMIGGWIMSTKKHKPIDTYTVGGLLWGYNSEFLVDLKTFLNILPPQIAGGAADLLKTTKVGLLLNRNGTESEAATVFTVDTGVKGLNNLAKVRSFNGDKSVNYWGSDYANMINGTDGSIFHPGITEDDTLYFFSPDVCRSMYAKCTGEQTLQGIRTLKFTPPEEVFAGYEDNPSNIDFCQPDFNNDSCAASGLLKLSECKQGAPIVLSQPHLCQADIKIQNSIKGIHPDPTKHMTTLNVEPTTGLVIQARKRLQLNIQIFTYVKTVEITAKMKNKAIVPLMWLEEGFSADEAKEYTTMVKEQLSQINMSKIFMYVCIICGSLILLAILLAILRPISKKKASEPVTVRNPPTKMSAIKRDSVHLDAIDMGHVNLSYQRDSITPLYPNLKVNKRP